MMHERDPVPGQLVAQTGERRQRQAVDHRQADAIWPSAAAAASCAASSTRGKRPGSSCTATAVPCARRPSMIRLS